MGRHFTRAKEVEVDLGGATQHLLRIGDTITVTYVMAAYDEARSRSSATVEITKGSSEVVASAIHLMKWLNR